MKKGGEEEGGKGGGGGGRGGGGGGEGPDILTGRECGISQILHQIKISEDIVSEIYFLTDDLRESPRPLFSAVCWLKKYFFYNCHSFAKSFKSIASIELTRPDICFAVNWLSRYMSKPTGSLFKACKQVLRIGQGTSRHSTNGIFVKCIGETEEIY
ncbi:hypothetical protein DERP_006938 [Dermatophagoides pteronyssinus]|uniref:Uncharacterized protein n=1 Tax=Dermatophagoides pteronyssinus TaxID=6956 RepID=A0ABQ8JTS6_DERPT|nr:hypothetical protein DERP_006938 [Dermatophagoides pteronyssinus]